MSTIKQQFRCAHARWRLINVGVLFYTKFTMFMLTQIMRWLVPLLAVALGFSACLVLPGSPEDRLRFGLTIAGVTLFFGGASFFLSSLRHFKLALKIAYILLASGIVLYGASFLQLPIIGIFDLWSSAWVTTGLVLVPFAGALLLIYAGLRRFARLLDITNLAARASAVSGAALVLGFVSTLTAYLSPVFYEGLEAYIAVSGAALPFVGAATYLAFQIRKRLGGAYVNAMTWLCIALVGMSTASLHEFVIAYFVPETSPYISLGLSMLPTIITAALLCEAGYRFCNMQVELLGSPVDEKATDDLYINAIIRIAAKASRRDAIDPWLDDMRIITSKYNQQQRLTDNEKRTLLRLYSRIETYLLTQDPLRTFTIDQLRRGLHPIFLKALAQEAKPPVQPHAA